MLSVQRPTGFGRAVLVCAIWCLLLLLSGPAGANIVYVTQTRSVSAAGEVQLIGGSPVSQSQSQSAGDLSTFNTSVDAGPSTTDASNPQNILSISVHAEMKSQLLASQISSNGKLTLVASGDVSDTNAVVADGSSHTNFSVSFRTTERVKFHLDFSDFSAFAVNFPTFTGHDGNRVPGVYDEGGDTFSGFLTGDGILTPGNLYTLAAPQKLDQPSNEQTKVLEYQLTLDTSPAAVPLPAAVWPALASLVYLGIWRHANFGRRCFDAARGIIRT
jgi:hypothetical protein